MGYKVINDVLAKELQNEPTLRNGLGPPGQPHVLDGWFVPTWVWWVCELVPARWAEISVQRAINVVRADPARLLPALRTVRTLGGKAAMAEWVLAHEKKEAR
jgi:hypothetical protein